MDDPNTYFLLGVTPSDLQDYEEAPTIAFIKNKDTNKIFQHKILNRPTHFPKLQSYPSEYITSNVMFYDEKTLLEAIESHPKETWLITFDPSPKRRLSLLPFEAKATSFDRIRLGKKKHYKLSRA